MLQPMIAWPGISPHVSETEYLIRHPTAVGLSLSRSGRGRVVAGEESISQSIEHLQSRLLGSTSVSESVLAKFEADDRMTVTLAYAIATAIPNSYSCL